MVLDDDMLGWLYLQGTRGAQESRNRGGVKSDSSFMSVLVDHKYLFMALFVAVVTFLLTITTLRSVRHRKEKNERPPSGKRHPLIAVLARMKLFSFTTITEADDIRPRFFFWRPQVSHSHRQISARTSKLTISKYSPKPVVSGNRDTAINSANKHGFPSNKDTIMGNNSANKTTKTSDCESHTDMATSVITFTNRKALMSQLNRKVPGKVVPSLELTGKDRESSVYTKDRSKTTNLAQEVKECDDVAINGIAFTSKCKGGRDYRKRSTEDMGSGSNKLPNLAIDKFREINCFRAAECKDNVSSRKHTGSAVKGYDYKRLSYSKADVIHKMKTSDVASGRHVKGQFSKISIEDCMDDIKISLRDDQYVPTHRKSCKTRDEAYHGSIYFQDQWKVKSDSVKSDSVISANEAAVDVIAENLSSMYKYSNNQEDNISTDFRMRASTQGWETEGCTAYSDLHGVKTNKSSQWTSHRDEIAEQGVRTPETRVRSRSSSTGSCSASDDLSWSFTRGNPVFEDRYTSFMKVSSMSRTGSSRLKRTIQLEPRPSKKLMVPKSKYEKLCFHSEQWPDEILYNKHKVPKLACLLLHPDDYLLEHGKQIGAQKVYTKDGFKFIVPLTFVSYGDKKKRVGPISEETNDYLGFSLSNLSVDYISNHKADDVSSMDIHHTDESDDISNKNFEGNVRKPGLGISRNTRRSSPRLSSVHVEDVEDECGLVNCYDNQELPRIMKKKLQRVRSFQDGAKHNRARSAECGKSVLKMFSSAGKINETKPKEIGRSSNVPVCAGCLNSENMETKDVTTNINEIIGKGSKRRTVQQRMKSGTGAESMKNVSKWLSDACSSRSDHSSCSSHTTVGLKRPEILARKQSTRAHSCSHKDYISSESGSWHPLQGHKTNPQVNCHRVAYKYLTPGILQSHLTRKQLGMDAKNEISCKMDKGTSSQSNSSLSLAHSPMKQGITTFIERRKAHFRANDEDDYRYNSDSLNDSDNKEVQYHHHPNGDYTKMSKKKLEKFHKLIKKLTAKRTQDRFQCRRFHRSKRSYTELDSLGDVSVLGSVPVSYKSVGKLASASPTFAHMPLFKNRHTESVNIIVRLESSAQKNLMEKHTYGSLLSAGVAAGDSCLPGDPDCCFVRKHPVTSETPVVDSAMRCLVNNCDMIFGNKDSPVKVFRQKQLRDITQVKQQFTATADGNEPEQLHLQCAVLATDDRGLMSVKKFQGNIQEQDSMFRKDLSDSKDQSNIIEDLTNLDLNSDPTSVHQPMKWGNAQGKLPTSAIEASGNEKLNMIHETNTEHNPMHKVGYESIKTKPEQLSMERHDDGPMCHGMIHKDRTLNTRLFPKLPHKDNKHTQQYHVTYEDNPQDLVKDCVAGTKMKSTSNVRSNYHVRGLTNYRLQKQEKKVQEEVPDRSMEQISVLLAESGLKRAASNSCITDDDNEITMEKQVKACRRDGTRVTTSGHAIKHVRNSTHVSSDHAKELTEDFKRSSIQFPGNDNGKQTSIVTNNKQVSLVKQTFSDSSKHLQQTTHLEDQYPQQNSDADFLNTTTATNTETMSTANMMSRHMDHGLTDKKNLSTLPKEETECPRAVRSLFSKHLSRSCKHATGTTASKDITKKRWRPHTDDKCIMSSTKTKTHRTLNQLQKLAESTDTKEINRHGSSLEGNLEEQCFSSVFKSHYSQKERYPEKQDEINITYSKENVSNTPHACDSSDISQGSGHFSKENQTYGQIYDDKNTLQPSNQRNQQRCKDGKLFPRKYGHSIYQMKKYKTLTKAIQKPNKRLQNPNEQVSETSACSPTHQQTSEKTKKKPEGPNNEINKSIQVNEKVASPEYLQKILKRHFSKQKVNMNSLSQQKVNMNSLSQSMIPEKRNETNGKSCCKVSAHSEHSFTFNTDNINKTDKTKVKNGMKGNGTNKQPSSQSKEIDNLQETTSKLNKRSTFAANTPRHWQESNARQHHCPRPRLSHPIDSATSGTDAGLKSGTQSRFKKPSNLQHILFKKMFKFCTGEEKKSDSEHQSDPAVALETAHTKILQTKPLMCNDRLNTGKPKDAWIVKQLSEVLKLDNLRENKSGIDGQAGLQHLQTLVAKNCIGDKSALGQVEKNHYVTDTQVEKNHYVTDTDTHKNTHTSCDDGTAKDPGFQSCADSILDDTEECRLPDRLPGKIGGSTEVSSADISDLGCSKCDKQLVSVGDEQPADKHGDWKSLGRVNVDELRQKYLREMSQKGLFRNRTFDIQNQKNKVHDLEDTILKGSNNRRSFSSDTTIIKSPVSLQSRNMAVLSKVKDFYTSNISCNGSPSNLKRKREHFKYEGLKAATKNTNPDNKNLVDVSSNDKCIPKDIPEKQFLTGSECEKFPKVTLNKNNKIILPLQNGMSVKSTAYENIQICSSQSKSDVAIIIKKSPGSCENCTLYSPINQVKHDSVQVEPHRDLSVFTGLRQQLEMSNSNSPSSTSANIPFMDYSELTSQTYLPSAGTRAKPPSDPHVISRVEDNTVSTQENCPSHAGHQKQAYQCSLTRRSQQFASRRPSQIPKMKRSETSFSQIRRSDTRSFSQLQSALNYNQKATTVKHFQSPSYRLETISIKHQPMNETHFACQSPNKTHSEKGKQQNNVSNIRSPDSSTDVVISWCEKENAHDTYQQDTDTELMSSLHNNPQSTVSHSPSNYTLTTICGFQGENVPMTASPDELVKTAEVNKQLSVHRFIPQTRSDTNGRPDIKSQASREQVSESMKCERPHGKNVPENISLKNSNEELPTNKDDSNKIPFWQKQSRSNDLRPGYGADRSVLGKKATSVRAKESKDRIGISCQSEGHSCKVKSLVKAFDNKYPAVNKEQPGTSSIHQQEGESKKPALVNTALNSRLRSMRGLAKNRKYVNSALMYNMKKQNTNLPYKLISDSKQQHSMLKNPALSTNNSAVLDKGDLYLKHQIPPNAHFYNTKARASNSTVERCQLQARLHKHPTASKVYGTTNQNAIYFHSKYEPACKQMKMDVTNFDTSSGYSMQGYVQESTKSLNRNSAAHRLERNIPPVTVPLHVHGGDADANTKHATEYPKNTQNKQDESEDNYHEEDNTDDQSQRAHPEIHHTNGSACTASDSPKMSFDWYKPLATSNASAAEHDQVLKNEHQRRFVFDWRRQGSNNSEADSHQQQLFVCNTPGNNGEVNYGTSLFEETKPVSQKSLCFRRSWNQQGFMQANMQNSRQNIRPRSQKNIWSVIMSEKRRISVGETHEYRHTLAHDLGEPNTDTSKDGRFQRPSHVLPIDIARIPQHCFQHTRMNQPVSIALADPHKNQPVNTAWADLHTNQSVSIAQTDLHTIQPVNIAWADLHKNQPVNIARADLHKNQPLNISQADLHNNQPVNTARADLHKNQPVIIARADLHNNQPVNIARVDLHKNQPVNIAPADLHKNQPVSIARADLHTNQPVNIAWADLHKNQSTRNGNMSDTVPFISDSRSHYTSNVLQLGSQHYSRPENPFSQVLADEDSLSNLNALYEHLQQNYNQANAVYHSNWVLANQNNSLNDLKTIPGQFGCCTNSKSNTDDIKQLLLKEHNSQTYNDFRRNHFHHCHQNITSSSILPHKRSHDDQCVQFRHHTSNNVVVKPDLSENRRQCCCCNQNQHFITGSNNSCIFLSHQNMPANVSRFFPKTPEFPASPDNLPTWQHLHQPPSNHHNIRNEHPPTLSEYVFPPNRWCSSEQTLLLPKKRADHSDCSYGTARGDNNG